MNWHSATKAQLKEIAYNDTEASMIHKAAAEAELMRRNNKRLAKPSKHQTRRLFAR